MLRTPFVKPKTFKQNIALYVRVTEKGGRRRYLRFNRKKIVPGIYCLRYEQGDKRKWEAVGTDLNAAMEAKFTEAKRFSTHGVTETKPAAPRRKTLARLRDDFLEAKRLTKKSDGTRPVRPSVRRARAWCGRAEVYGCRVDGLMFLKGGLYFRCHCQN